MPEVTTPNSSVPTPEKKGGKTALIVCGCLFLFGLAFVGIAAVAGYLYYQFYQDTQLDLSSADPKLVNNSNSVTQPYNGAIEEELFDFETEDNTNTAVDTNSNETVTTFTGDDVDETYANIKAIVERNGYDMTYNETKINDLMTYSGFSDDSANFFSVIETESTAPMISVTTRLDGAGAIDPTFLEAVVYEIKPSLQADDWIASGIAAAEEDISNNLQMIEDDGYYYALGYNTMELNNQTISTATVTITQQ